MSPEFVISITTKALQIALLVAAPMLLFGLIAGLIISIFQAVTQIQEMTLTFIPKILAVVAAVVIFFPWMLQTVLTFTHNLFANMYIYIGK
jgi:flagellar biosynthetic protein FliQ